MQEHAAEKIPPTLGLPYDTCQKHPSGAESPKPNL
jgi:hypothetical protein